MWFYTIKHNNLFHCWKIPPLAGVQSVLYKLLTFWSDKCSERTFCRWMCLRGERDAPSILIVGFCMHADVSCDAWFWSGDRRESGWNCGGRLRIRCSERNHQSREYGDRRQVQRQDECRR